MKEIIDKLDYIKIKNFSEKKDNVKRMRRQTTNFEKIFAKDHLLKDCYPKYTKNSQSAMVQK
jgi:hypothetical protein